MKTPSPAYLQGEINTLTIDVRAAVVMILVLVILIWVLVTSGR